tara:strand:+ start:995 stop:2656 length:1662 start_codon:yes stop_codon:yes gene_type:complete
MAIFSPSESPAIVVKEVDLTGGVPNVQSTTGAIVGGFRWGPVEQATLVGDEASLASTFGAPNDSSAVDFLSASNFLRYTSALQVVRVVDNATALNAAATKLRSGQSADSDHLIKSDTAFDDATTLNSVFYAKYPGDLGNSLKVAIADATNWSAGFSATHKAQFDDAPVGAERHVLVIDEDGTITGTSGSVLERFPYVNTGATSVNADGSTNYMRNVINRGSNYIYCNVTTGADMAAHAADSNGEYSFTSGTTGATLGTADYLLGFDQLEDKDTVTVDFMIAPGMATAGDQATVVNDLVSTASATRKDCVVVTSPAKASVVANANPTTASVTDASAYTYSSYLFVDNNWLKVYDKYNDKYVYIPAASSTAGIMAAADANSAPWFSPAGARRGAYLGVTGLSYTPTKSQRDTLYKAGVNPIANLPGQGILLYGDKTHMNRPSAFDRINVRRLFNVVERAIGTAARNTLFELNDEFTRAEFVNIVEPFLREIKGRRGITDFRVVCDETNNTGAVVDRNEFIANIFIKPARSINYITLNFVAVRSGVDFEEVAGLSV